MMNQRPKKKMVKRCGFKKGVDNTPPPKRAPCRWCGASILATELDIFCCPLAEPSPHCLWCGETLSTTDAFCTPTCSGAYHDDVAPLLRRTG